MWIMQKENGNYYNGFKGLAFRDYAVRFRDQFAQMGTPNREPQEYSRNRMEYRDPGRYIPIILLPYSCGSLFGVPILVPLIEWPDPQMGTTPVGRLGQDLGFRL